MLLAIIFFLEPNKILVMKKKKEQGEERGDILRGFLRFTFALGCILSSPGSAGFPVNGKESVGVGKLRQWGRCVPFFFCPWLLCGLPHHHLCPPLGSSFPPCCPSSSPCTQDPLGVSSGIYSVALLHLMDPVCNWAVACCIWLHSMFSNPWHRCEMPWWWWWVKWAVTGVW